MTELTEAEIDGRTNFYLEKSDMDIARHINLALLICNGIGDEDAGFDTVVSLNDAGLAAIERIIGRFRAALTAAAQVREMAPELICVDDVNRVAEAIMDARARGCNLYGQGFAAIEAMASPALMPIYSATEDQG